MTARPSYENRLVAILAVAGGVAAVDILAFPFLSPFIAADLRLDNGQIGMVAGIGMLAWSLGAMLSSYLSDRIARRVIFLVGALASFALFSSTTAFATSFATLVAARLLVGLCEGPVIPMQNAIMHAESTPQRRGLNMGIVQNFGAHLMGGLFGPLVLVAIAGAVGWRNAFLIASAPALVMAIIVHVAVREPPRLPGDALRLPVWDAIRTVAAVRNIRLCFLVGTCGVGWLLTMSIFIPLWTIRQLHFTPTAMSIAMAFLGAGGAVASIVVPALSDRVGRRPALIGFSLVGLVLPIGLLFGAPSLAMVSMTIFVGSLFTGIFPLFIGIIPMESVEARQGATALSIVMGCAQIAGSVLGPVAGGMLADRFSLAVPFWLAGGYALGAALFAVFLTETAPARRSGDESGGTDKSIELARN